MKFDFSNENFFDNHTHLLYTDKTRVTVDEFIGNYYHGFKHYDKVSKEYLPYQGVILSLVHYLAQKLDCDETLEAVVAKRNELTATPATLQEYTKNMYEEEHIIGTMLDSELPMGDEATKCFPCKTFRLYQFERPFDRLIKSESCYEDLLVKELHSISMAAKEGFDGLKGHIAERYGFDVHDVDKHDAERAFIAAKQGDKKAEREVYYAMFTEVMLLCKELDLPIHLHAGSSGFGKFTNVYSHDPLLMVKYLSDPKFAETKVMFLHGSYPFIRHSAMMCFNFPNVWMDLSQTLPWDSMALANMLEDVLAVAPHNKVLLGSGQHFYSETAWMAAKSAKSAMAMAMDRIVEQDLISKEQAERSARMILSENAMRLYDK